LKTSKNLEGPLSEVKLNWARIQQGRQAVVDRLVKGLEFLLGRNKIQVIKGRARLTGPEQVQVRTASEQMILEADKVILATGSRR